MLSLGFRLEYREFANPDLLFLFNCEPGQASPTAAGVLSKGVQTPPEITFDARANTIANPTKTAHALTAVSLLRGSRPALRQITKAPAPMMLPNISWPGSDKLFGMILIRLILVISWTASRYDRLVAADISSRRVFLAQLCKRKFSTFDDKNSEIPI